MTETTTLEEKIEKLEKRLELIEKQGLQISRKIDELDRDFLLGKTLVASLITRMDAIEHPNLQPALQAFNKLRAILEKKE